jgi:purine-binding chemotaxis protein CheW
MPAVDLRRCLAFLSTSPSPSAKLLVLKTSDGPTSVLVDEIGDVLTLPAAGWRPAPDTIAASHRRAVTGIYASEGRIVVGLNVEALLDEPRASRSSRGSG